MVELHQGATEMEAQMISDRDRFIARQTEINNEFARLTPGEDELIAVFSRLAMETHDILAAQGVRTIRTILGFGTWPESASFVLQPGNTFDKIPPSLLERWHQWERNYPAVEARNPRLELRNLMQTMSETILSESWPQQFEWAIERWVAGGDIDANPYYRDHKIYARLQALHERLNGWVYQGDDAYIYFAELEEFRQIERRRDEAHREIVQRQAEEYAARRAQMEARLASGSNSGVHIVVQVRPPK
jgi:hypothetical protein